MTRSRRSGAVREPVFGQIKEARGFRRFNLRSRLKVSAEWELVCAVLNLGKLLRSGRAGRVILGWQPERRQGAALGAVGWA